MKKSPPRKDAAAALQAKLIREAHENKYRLFTADELHLILYRAINFVLAAKNAGAPFPGNIARPEWIVDWLKEHPEFSVKSSKKKKNGKKI